MNERRFCENTASRNCLLENSVKEHFGNAKTGPAKTTKTGKHYECPDYCAQGGEMPAAQGSNDIVLPHVVFKKNVLDDVEHKLYVLCVCSAGDVAVHVAAGRIAI